MQQLLRTSGFRGTVSSSLALLVMLLTGPALVRADTSVSVTDNSFSPQTITIAPGDTVTWTNSGSMNHTVTADDGSFTSGTLVPGNSFTHTFSTVGSFPYYCQFHGAPGGVGMSGIVVVSNSATSTNSNASSTTSTTTDNTASSTSNTTSATNASSTSANNTSTSTASNASSTSSSNTTNTSTSTSNNTSSSTSATSTNSAPTLSNGNVVPNNTGAIITWTTDQNSDAQVSYGETTAYTTTTASDHLSGTNHTVIIAGLVPGILYHFKAMSTANGVTGSSSDQTFTTTNASSTGTGTSTSTSTPSGGGTSTSTTGTTSPGVIDLPYVSSQIARLESEIKMLQAQIQAIFSGGGINIPGGPTTSTEGTAVYADNYAVSPGGAVHFTGNGFGPNETVNISVNGTLIGQAHTGSDGTFSISGTAANTEGDTTYWFQGTNSGDSDSVMITVESGDNQSSS